MHQLKAFFQIFICLAFMALSQSTISYAVNPDEVLKDTVLEQRARELSGIIRCMKCQNQSIDDSDADLAKDLRLLVRDRLTKGDTDQQVLDYLVDRYGEFVLLKPSFSIANLFLWLAPLVALMAGLILSWRAMAKRRSLSFVAEKELSRNENEQLTKILEDSE